MQRLQPSFDAFPRRAFSLVELSIVLVILGLLVGGVLSGRSLIRAAELRSITTEKDKITAAIFTFRDKYFYLPGDLPNAFQFWGATCGTNDTTASTGCNGDGNGIVWATDNEGVRVWEHLSRAGLIEGSYDGAGALNVTTLILSTSNTPAAKFSKSYWNASNVPIEYPNYTEVNLLYLALGSLDTYPAQNGWVGPIASLSLIDAYGIDKKIDDGLSDTGRVRGRNDTDCADTAGDPYSMAALGAETKGLCILSFWLL